MATLGIVARVALLFLRRAATLEQAQDCQRLEAVLFNGHRRRIVESHLFAFENLECKGLGNRHVQTHATVM